MAEARHGWRQALLDLLFPPRCAGCRLRGLWLCEGCAATLPRLQPPVCRYCGRPTKAVATCPDCWKSRPATDGVVSPLLFQDTLRKLIHRFKYRNARYLAQPLAMLLAGEVRSSLPAADAIVPVPLHPSRLRKRGYNQAALLATALAPELGVRVVDGCLVRVRDTPPQMGLPAAERRRNVRNAFRCVDKQLAGLTIIVVDDVCTTGATLDACAKALKTGGAKVVYGLTLARAV